MIKTGVLHLKNAIVRSRVTKFLLKIHFADISRCKL
jgi:hypothetical protein